MKASFLSSLLSASLLVGCSGEAKLDHAAAAEPETHDEHVHDAEQGELVAYFLGAHADSPLRLIQGAPALEFMKDGSEQSFVLQAVASTLTGETVGDTSQFHLQDDALVGISIARGRLGPIEVLGQSLEGQAYGN